MFLRKVDVKLYSQNSRSIKSERIAMFMFTDSIEVRHHQSCITSMLNYVRVHNYYVVDTIHEHIELLLIQVVNGIVQPHL